MIQYIVAYKRHDKILCDSIRCISMTSPVSMRSPVSMKSGALFRRVLLLLLLQLLGSRVELCAAAAGQDSSAAGVPFFIWSNDK